MNAANASLWTAVALIAGGALQVAIGLFVTPDPTTVQNGALSVTAGIGILTASKSGPTDPTNKVNKRAGEK